MCLTSQKRQHVLQETEDWEEVVSPFVHGGQRQRAGCGHAREGQSEAVPQGDGSLHTRIQPGAEQPDTAAHHRPLAGGVDGTGGDGEEVREGLYRNGGRI